MAIMFAARSIIFAFLFCLSFVASYETSSGADRALAIRNVLAKYAILIDNQNLGALGEIFTDDVVANYTGQDGKVLLEGIPAIQDFLKTRYGNLTNGLRNCLFEGACSLRNVNHQHALTTQNIEDDTRGATVTTYFTATFFGTGNKTGIVSSWGKYVDELAPQADGGWKIVSRDQGFMGPYVGDFTIFS